MHFPTKPKNVDRLASMLPIRLVPFNCLLQAYHSSFVNTNENIGNMAFLPFKTNFRGPVTNFNPEFQLDIIDEALYFFRANVFFRTYEIKVISIVLHSESISYQC